MLLNLQRKDRKKKKKEKRKERGQMMNGEKQKK